MKYIVEESWFRSPERRRFKEYCDQYERLEDLPSHTHIAEAVGVSRWSVGVWSYVALGKLSWLDEAVRRAHEALLTVDGTITWGQLARAAHTAGAPRWRAEVKRRFPTLVHKIRVGRTTSVDTIERDRAIVAMYLEGHGTKYVAQHFHVCRATVRVVLRREGVFDEDETALAINSYKLWEQANLVDFVTPDNDYLERQRARGMPIVCYPRAIWERYRAIWEKKERARLLDLAKGRDALDELVEDDLIL